MTALSIVEHFDIVEHICLCLLTGSIANAIHALSFQHTEEALHNRIVIAVATPTHAALDAVSLKLLAEVIARILGATDALMFVKQQLIHDKSL